MRQGLRPCGAPNAFAIPRSHVYVFDGLTGKANTPDELAGVIAHQTRARHAIATALAVAERRPCGSVFDVLLGDFAGGGAAVIGVRTVLQTSYSRETEAAADAYGARRVQKIGAHPCAIGVPARKAANAARLLTPAAWTRQKNICAATGHPAGRKP